MTPNPALPLRIALVGYGKMGRMLEQLAPSVGCAVVLKLDQEDNVDGGGITEKAFEGVDAAIEFSTPETVIPNVLALAKLRKPAVIGTTGWFDNKGVVRKAVEQAGSGLIYGANFSVGVNAFYRIVESAAKVFRNAEDYDALAYEAHHKHKKDAPSGMMLRLLEAMRGAGYERSIDVAHNRAGAIPGTHQIAFDSEADTLELRHTARSRAGFARGALRAARWIVDKKGFFDFSNVWEQML